MTLNAAIKLTFTSLVTPIYSYFSNIAFIDKLQRITVIQFSTSEVTTIWRYTNVYIIIIIIIIVVHSVNPKFACSKVLRSRMVVHTDCDGVCNELLNASSQTYIKFYVELVLEKFVDVPAFAKPPTSFFVRL